MCKGDIVCIHHRILLFSYKTTKKIKLNWKNMSPSPRDLLHHLVFRSQSLKICMNYTSLFLKYIVHLFIHIFYHVPCSKICINVRKPFAFIFCNISPYSSRHSYLSQYGVLFHISWNLHSFYEQVSGNVTYTSSLVLVLLN